MAYAPVLSPFGDAAPCPRVEVYFGEFAPGTATVTVSRTAEGRTFEVRGAVGAATAGSLSRIDFECPLNTRVAYRAEMFDASGVSLGFTDESVLGDLWVGLPPEVDLPPSEGLTPSEYLLGVGLVSADSWLHNPLDPQGAVRVVALDSSARALSRPALAEVSYPLGRRVGVVLSRGRAGLRGFTYDVFAEDLVTADRVQSMLGDYSVSAVPVLCLRVGGGESRMRVPKPLFLSVFDAVEEDLNVRLGGSATVQRLTGDEVAPPVPGLFVPLLTNADLNAFYASNGVLNSDNVSSGAVNRRYDLAGFSG